MTYQPVFEEVRPGASLYTTRQSAALARVALGSGEIVVAGAALEVVRYTQTGLSVPLEGRARCPASGRVAVEAC